MCSTLLCVTYILSYVLNIFMSHLQEELAEGLHLIDFEQLKIENQTYNEKIEERNEVFLKFFNMLVWVLALPMVF